MKARVLVIDDDTPVLRSIERLLRRHYDVTTFSNGRDALTHLTDDHGFHVILCDMTMPQMDGMELYQELESLSVDLRERVVFLTGGAITERARAFLKQVSNRILEKPVDPDELRSVIARAAARSA